ncbi:related to transporter (major facilitator superfamily) [Cephalotrichum gorgonifer]|uniref:Related to transporter (Major facilitator superfamily) n=1 Tax=Cephalotrichum gorgonifer TaxID=2041049 RepID=A0AAE8ST16_9PEZI|nr:related to transporter (major facilitator superfamily) [Cephalotrichum gorgonifer]
MGPSGGASPTGDIEIAYGPSGIKGLAREPYIFFLACFASIGGVLFGYDQGVISGVLVMNNFGKQFPTLANDPVLQGWMVAVLTLGAMFGALANGPIADRISRRWSILLANIVFLIGSIIQAASVNVPMMFVGRFIAGLSIGQLSMVVPLYLSELSPPNLRGSLVSLQQLGITVGIMIAFWLDYGTQYIGGTGDDREDEAQATLIRIRRVPGSDPRVRLELQEIKAMQIFDKETTEFMYPGIKSPVALTYQTYKSLFVVRHLNRRLLIACLLQIVGQFTGINAIIYYAPQIFGKIGLDGNSINLLATGVVGIINLLATIPAIMFIDRWGRKTVTLIGATGMGISQLIVGAMYAVYKDSWADHKAAGWATAAFVWIYIIHFAFSMGCIIWIVPSEIFPPGVRSQAVGVAIGTNWLANFIVALITSRMLEAIQYGTFFFFSGFCIFLFFWVLFGVPETKGVRIEEMDKLFGGNQGEQDMTRMARIRRDLGITGDNTADQKKDIRDDVEAEQVE